MNRNEVAAADAEYVALLNMYAAEDLAEARRDDVDANDWSHDPERTGAWSAAFETDDESRLEMEADDMRCGGTFSELLFDSL